MSLPKTMNVEFSYPPNIEKIRATFTLHKGIVFTYGDTIFNPDRSNIDPALACHEATHCRQQGDDPESWWERYLVDPQWRVLQEIEAYRAQWKQARKMIKDRNIRHKLLMNIARDLSSAIYGNAISFDAAYKAIKHERMF
jgi:hypothetical protein